MLETNTCYGVHVRLRMENKTKLKVIRRATGPYVAQNAKKKS